MSLYFADADTLTFGVQSSNTAEVAQFSSTTDEAFLHLYTNNYTDNENFTTGVAIGSKSFSANANDLYLGNITNGGSAVQRVLTMRQDRIGIGTTTPTSILHVVGSNLPAASNILLVQAINSPAYPALVVDKWGYVGIGTAPNSNNTLTISGKLMVDNIQVGGTPGASGTSKLISAYGMVAPSDATYLDFAYGTMSNISNVVTPLLEATNVTQTFTNIANYTFLNDFTTTISSATLQGNVTFTTTFNGNSPSYVYTLTTSNMSTGQVVNVAGSPFTTTESKDSRTGTFVTGTYALSMLATASNGVGAGSYVIKNKFMDFTVGITDTIGTPSVSIYGSPAPSFGSTLTYVSGIPYYTDQVVITFSPNAIAFTNMYNVVNPVTLIPYALTIGTTSYTHSDLFTNVSLGTTRNLNTVYHKISSTANPTTSLTIPATVYNVNGSNINSTFVSSIAFVGTPINESTLQVASYTQMPITSVTRLSVSSTAVTPSQPSIFTDLTTFSNMSISTNDAIYFPYTSTFYSSYTTISAQRGSYAPSYIQVTGSHNVLVLKVQTLVALFSFVLNCVGSSGIASVYVNWASVNSGANWYNANKSYTTAMGCSAGQPTSTRFPIRIESATLNAMSSTTLTTATDIYIAITFSGSIPLSGISIINQ